MFHGIKDPVRSFIGREDKLLELGGLIQNSMLPAVTVSGLAGMGKSELVRKYISLNKATIPICHWVNGDSAESLRSSLEQFGGYLKVPTTDKMDAKPLQLLEIVKNILTQVRETMNLFNEGNYTIVIDNVDDAYEDFITVTKLLCSYSRSNVIITSRLRDVLSGETEFLELSEWTEEDAFEYVNRILKTPPSDPDVGILCSTLQFYPLALSQAVAYIRHQQRISLQGHSYSVKHYLAEYESKAELILNTTPKISTYEQTSLVVLNITIDKMKSHHEHVGHVAYSCLELFSFLNPDGIEVTLLKYFLKRIINERSKQPDESEENMTLAVQLLVYYSLISVQNCVATIHRVVQKVTGLRINETQRLETVPSSNGHSKKNDTREIEILESILPTIQEKIYTIGKSEIVHILSIMDHTVNHLSLVTKYCQLYYDASCRLDILRMDEVLLTFSTKYHSTLKNSFGEQHVSTVLILMKWQIGKSLWQIGRAEEAAEALEESYLQMERVLGDSHEETLTAGCYYSNALLNMDRVQEAYDILHKTCNTIVIKYGNDSEQAKNTFGLLGLSLIRLGKLAEAKLIYKELLEFFSKNYEKTHPLTLRTKHNLAYGLYSEGKYLEARKLFSEVVQLEYEHESPDELWAAETMFWIARCDRRCGKFKEALLTFESVLAIRKRELGETHPETIQALNQVKSVKLELGNCC